MKITENRLGHKNDVYIVVRYPFHLEKSLSKKNWDSTFSQTEELHAGNLSKRLKSRLSRN